MIRLLYLANLVFLFSCSANTKEKIEKKENPERFYLKAKIGELHNDNKYVYFSVITQLVNDTKDTINYASWSCAWDDNYNINSNHILVDRPGCNKNVAEVVTIFPDASGVEHILNCKTKLSYSHSLKLRVDFNYIPIDKNDDWDSIIYKLEKQPHFQNKKWSDSLTIL